MHKNLELSPEEMRSVGYRVIDILVEHFVNMKDERVGARAEPAKIRSLLAAMPLSNDACDPHRLLDTIQGDILPNTLNVAHPRFFAFVPGPNNFMSAMADVLAAGFNVFNGTWLGGSAAAAMELEVIDWLCGFCGLPETAGGLFVSGGSVANMTALVAARHAMLEDRVEGATIYCSDQTHSSVERALRVIGFQPQQIRHIPSDDQWRLPMDALASIIAADRGAGLRPFCVIANAGTTNTGAVDPLPELARICEAEGMWLHADGAYGAAAILSERGRKALSGLDQVDSLSLDPHKWLFQSFECGCVLLRDAALLKKAFQIMPEYLRDVHRGVDEVHPADYGIQLTRSFRALKVWLSLRTFGLDAFRAAIDHGFEMAEFAERELRSRPGWEILSTAEMGMVSFHYTGREVSHSAIVDAMLRDGYAFLSSTKLRGITALRLCTINPRTTVEDIRGTIDRLDRFAREC
jgi:glutamate/tyrosine decarboxylase-like PLP-dependent enzyme